MDDLTSVKYLRALRLPSSRTVLSHALRSSTATAVMPANLGLACSYKRGVEIYRQMAYNNIDILCHILRSLTAAAVTPANLGFACSYKSQQLQTHVA